MLVVVEIPLPSPTNVTYLPARVFTRLLFPCYE